MNVDFDHSVGNALFPRPAAGAGRGGAGRLCAVALGLGRPIAPARRAGLLVLRLAILAILGLIIFNPVRVDETPGTVERPKLFYLLDTSQSMAIGKGATRWDQVVETIRDVDQVA